MTKRDSVTAGFTFPPMSMNIPRRPSRSARHAGHSSEWHDSQTPASSYTSHPEYIQAGTPAIIQHMATNLIPQSMKHLPCPSRRRFHPGTRPQPLLLGIWTHKMSTHCNISLQKIIANYMLTTLLKLVSPEMIKTFRQIDTWWWQRWINTGSIAIVNRSTSSMGLLATFVHAEMDGLTLGLNRIS